MRTPVSIGVVGDRGPAAALVDTLEHLPQADVRWVCSERRDAHAPALRRGIRQTTRFADILDDERVDAIMVAAPAAARAHLAASTLDADKHVYVAGVPAQTSAQFEHLLGSARRRNRCFLSGDPWRFDPVTAKLSELIRAGDLGDLFYVHGDCRVTAGEDALLWSAVADEVALVLRILGDQPVSVSADGECYLDPESNDLIDVRLTFATGIVGRLTLTALDARPGSTHALVGSLATAVVERSSGAPATLSVHANDGAAAVVCPRIAEADPLRRSCEAFLAAVRSVGGPAQDAEAIAVVEALEHVQHALRGHRAVTLPQSRPTPELRVVGVSTTAS